METSDQKRAAGIIRSRMREIDKREVIVDAIGNVLGRYVATQDPIIRYTLFLDKLLIVFDVLAPMLISDNGPFGDDSYEIDSALDISSSEKYSAYLTKQEKLKDKIAALCKSSRAELAKLMDYVQRDMYAPDHRAGAELLQTAEKDFQERTDAD